MVSIIIPVFNRAHIVKETIESIKNQTYSNWEALFIDDGSTDDTIEIIKSASKNDPRFILLRRPKSRVKGANTCRNIGIENAEGEYLIFLDSDDLLSDSCLAERIVTISREPKYDFIVFPGLVFTNKTKNANTLISCPEIENDFDSILDHFLKFDVPWVIFSPIWRLSSIQKTKLDWAENRKCFQDIEFHIKALCKGLRFKIMSESQPDTYWRRNDDLEHIGSSIVNELNIESTYQMLRDMYHVLQKKNLLNRKRIKNLIKVNFQHVIYPNLRLGNEKSASSYYNRLSQYLKLPFLKGIYIQLILKTYLSLARNKYKVISSPSYKLFHFFMKKSHLMRNDKVFLKCKYERL